MAVKGGHSCLDPFFPVPFVSFSSCIVFHFCGHIPGCAHSPALDDAASLSTAKQFLGSSFTPAPPCPPYQRALEWKLSLLQKLF